MPFINWMLSHPLEVNVFMFVLQVYPFQTSCIANVFVHHRKSYFKTRAYLFPHKKNSTECFTHHLAWIESSYTTDTLVAGNAFEQFTTTKQPSVLSCLNSYAVFFKGDWRFKDRNPSFRWSLLVLFLLLNGMMVPAFVTICRTLLHSCPASGLLGESLVFNYK